MAPDSTTHTLPATTVGIQVSTLNSTAQAKVLAALPGDAQHTYNSTDPSLGNTWNFIMQGIARSLIALNELPLIEEANVGSYLTEARGMLCRERGFELY